MRTARKPVAPTADERSRGCDQWNGVEWRASEVAPILLIVPTAERRQSIGAALDEWIGTGDLDRALLIAEQELPSVVVLEVATNWTEHEIATMLRLQRLLPHGKFIAIAPKHSKEGMRLAMDRLLLDAYFFTHAAASTAEYALKLRARYLEWLADSAEQARKVRR